MASLAHRFDVLRIFAERVALAQVRHSEHYAPRSVLRWATVFLCAPSRTWLRLMQITFPFALASPAGALEADLLAKLVPALRILLFRRHWFMGTSA
jgi:hypothetical protein